MTGLPQLIPGSSLDEIYLSIVDLAAIYGVDDETVRLWETKRSWIHRTPRGFQLTSCLRGVYEGQLAAINRKKGPEGEELLHLEQREQKAKTEKAEIEVARLRSELIPADEVEKRWFDIARRTRDSMESIPSRISAIITAEQDEHKVKEILSTEIQQALEGLSK